MLDSMTLDQLRVLVAIAEAGSFSAAGRRIRRAQSAVSHAIATLEASLGVALFDRSARTPRLTEAGAAVLADARVALGRIEVLRARAKGLGAGVEPEVTLAVTVLCPTGPLIAVLERFSAAFPLVGLSLSVEEIGGAATMVEQGICALGIVGTLSLRMTKPGALAARLVGEVEMVAVVARGHPLASREGPLADADLDGHRQLVPTSRARQPFPFALARDLWLVDDIRVRVEMILAGLGWGTVPRHLVARELAEGRLVTLALTVRPDALMRIGLFAVNRVDTAPGPAARWFEAELRAALAGE